MRHGTPTERNKLLRYCLARLRAWRAEYALYSISGAAAGSVELESRRIETRNYPNRGTFEEQTMTERPCHSPNPHGWTIADEALADYAGSIDTATVSLFAPATNLVLDAATPRNRPTARERSERVSSSDHVGLAYDEQSPKTHDKPRPRTFAPLPGVAPIRPAPPPRRVIESLQIPKVVSQVMSDGPEHWVSLAKGIESRVRQDGLGTLLVTASTLGEGATTVATALAVAVSEHTDLRVCFVDADFSHPSVAESLRIAPRVGLEGHLVEDSPLADAIISCVKPRLDVLPTCKPFEMPALAMGSSRLESALEELREAYDLVIVDCGGLLADRKPKPAPPGIDATLIVRNPSRCTPEQLDQLDAHLARLGICSLGVIENCVDG